MKKVNKEKKVNNTLAAVAGVMALSAAAYVLFGPKGKKNRKVIRGWAVKMKGEIIEKFEEAKDLTEPIYHKIINEVSKKYSQLKHIDKAELKNTVDEIKKQWKAIEKTSKKPSKKSKKK